MIEKPILLTIVRDTEGNLLEAIKNIDFSSYYSQVFINVTSDTDDKVKTELGKIGHVITMPCSSLSIARRVVLGCALNSVDKKTAWGTYYHYCDLDRLLYWHRTHPKELFECTQEQQPFLIFGRTEKAFDSHPLIQRLTEGFVNLIFWLDDFKRYDVLAASRLFSYQIADSLYRRSSANGPGVDVEWPLLINKFISYRAVDGLGYESNHFNIKREKWAELRLRLSNMVSLLLVFWRFVFVKSR